MLIYQDMNEPANQQDDNRCPSNDKYDNPPIRLSI